MYRQTEDQCDKQYVWFKFIMELAGLVLARVQGVPGTCGISEHHVSLCSWGANMSKKIVRDSSVDFHAYLAWLMP